MKAAPVAVLSDYQFDRAVRHMLQAARAEGRKEGRKEGRAEGYAVGLYDGVRKWAWATAPLLAVALGGGIVLAVAIGGWLA